MLHVLMMSTRKAAHKCAALPLRSRRNMAELHVPQMTTRLRPGLAILHSATNQQTASEGGVSGVRALQRAAVGSRHVDILTASLHGVVAPRALSTITHGKPAHAIRLHARPLSHRSLSSLRVWAQMLCA